LILFVDDIDFDGESLSIDCMLFGGRGDKGGYRGPEGPHTSPPPKQQTIYGLFVVFWEGGLLRVCGVFLSVFGE